MIPMRDGVKLATDIYRPADLTGPLPAILMRTPYNKQGNTLAGNVFASNGYVVVVQDVRGKFASEGEYRISTAT
jgi:putative CocE/NonD family hydrolase